MFFTVTNLKNSSTKLIQIIECEEEVKINLDDENIKLLNVDNIRMPNIIGVAYISYEDLYVNKKMYNISYYQVVFDYNDVYFFGIPYEQALELEAEIKDN